MILRISSALLALLLAAPIAAQVPEGLLMRVDRSNNVEDPDNVPEVTITAAASGYEITTGPAVTVWKPEQTARGNYSLSARFTLQEPSSHRNFYGLVFGGRNLVSENQRYLYFMIAQTGDFVIINRIDNTNTAQIQTYTAHPAIRRPEAGGSSVNDLEVRVLSSQIEFVVNGAVVHSSPKTGPLAETNGIYGVRVNHVLPGVLVENLRVTPN